MAHSLIEIVQHHDNSETECIVKTLHKLHQSELVTNIKIRCRLVEEQNLRLLCKCHSKTRPLALAARECTDRAHGKGLHPRPHQCFAADFSILFRECIPEAPMRQASHADEFEHGDVAGRLCTLREKGNPLRDLPFRLAPDIRAKEFHCAAARL